jgi:phosphoglucomutase
MDVQQQYRFWLESNSFDEATKAELRAIAGDDKEIEDRFYRDLEFGTGGMRGVIGAGTNRMNRYTVRKAAQGLASFLKKTGKSVRGVAIAFDSRNMSPEFAEETALVLAGNGIRAFLFESLRPVPELSFAVRHLGCAAGVVITASHNPKEYNGFKAYSDDGCQLLGGVRCCHCRSERRDRSVRHSGHVPPTGAGGRPAGHHRPGNR